MLKLHVRTFNPIQEPLLPGLDKSLSQRRSLQVNLILITSLKKKKKEEEAPTSTNINLRVVVLIFFFISDQQRASFLADLSSYR